MKFSTTSILPCSAEAAWRDELERTTALKGSRPWLAFSPVTPAQLPDAWAAGQTLTVRPRLFGLLPLGHYTIEVAELDETAMTLLTNEQGGLIRRWDHRVRIAPDGPGSCHYTDEIEFEAGLFTPIVWLLARLLYNDRQIRRHFKAERSW